MTPEGLIIESMFHIVDKDGVKRPFVLNDAQRRLDENFTGRDLVPKSRQQGVSRYVLARFTAACLGLENETCAVISHEKEATERLLRQCRYYLDHLRGDVKAETDRSSVNVISFPRTNSLLYIGTAGSKKFGRGDTIRRLHCSEYAYWPTPSDTLGGILQSVPSSGEIWLESTGNGRGNDYHRRCMRAYEGSSRWTCHFLSWLEDPSCTVELSDGEAERVLAKIPETVQVGEQARPNEEWTLVHRLGASAGNIVWRRMKLEELDYDYSFFRQEYPATIDECFQAARGGIFTDVNYVPTEQWQKLGGGYWGLQGHPSPHLTYVMGVDPSGGTKRDNAVVEVFCLEERRQVYEFTSNITPPDVLGQEVVNIAERFNNAYIVVESNNHGVVTLSQMRDTKYPRYLIHATGDGEFKEEPGLLRMGFRTTARSKPLMIGNLKRCLSVDGWTVHSPTLYDELSTFIEDPDTGKLRAADNCLDDRVMASACALMGEARAALRTRPSGLLISKKRLGKPDPFTGESIIKQLQSRAKGRYPVARHLSLRS